MFSASAELDSETAAIIAPAAKPASELAQSAAFTLSGRRVGVERIGLPPLLPGNCPARGAYPGAGCGRSI
jgi:hypothetical protein